MGFAVVCARMKDQAPGLSSARHRWSGLSRTETSTPFHTMSTLQVPHVNCYSMCSASYCNYLDVPSCIWHLGDGIRSGLREPVVWV